MISFSFHQFLDVGANGSSKVLKVRCVLSIQMLCWAILNTQSNQIGTQSILVKFENFTVGTTKFLCGHFKANWVQWRAISDKNGYSYFVASGSRRNFSCIAHRTLQGGSRAIQQSHNFHNSLKLYIIIQWEQCVVC